MPHPIFFFFNYQFRSDVRHNMEDLFLLPYHCNFNLENHLLLWLCQQMLSLSTRCRCCTAQRWYVSSSSPVTQGCCSSVPKRSWTTWLQPATCRWSMWWRNAEEPWASTFSPAVAAPLWVSQPQTLVKHDLQWCHNHVALWSMELPEMYKWSRLVPLVKTEGSRACPYKLPSSTSWNGKIIKMVVGIPLRGSVWGSSRVYV